MISDCAFCIYGSCMIFSVNRNYFLEQHNQLVFEMVKCCVFFEVRAEFFNVIQTSFGFKGLIDVRILLRGSDRSSRTCQSTR
jgi:hypothetical protein